MAIPEIFIIGGMQPNDKLASKFKITPNICEHPRLTLLSFQKLCKQSYHELLRKKLKEQTNFKLNKCKTKLKRKRAFFHGILHHPPA